ncbi:MAG TPA: methyltransferase domain-containing protein [Solirubrobacteraceae bacterium]|nr:methyltransferase domain-containing protein [Solirubrobacteraceae bacterium]
MTELEDDAVKQRQRAMWSAGDYSTVGAWIAPVGEVVAQTAAIEPGMKVLDVAAGSGNVAIPAAQAGGDVIGLDLTPALLDLARERADAAGVAVQWVEGDAEALPYEDESFDRVLSSFGVMFAPRHKVVAGELARVCRSGGRVVLANWTPDGFSGRFLQTAGKHLPPPPPGTLPPAMWGDERYVRTLLGGQLLLDQEVHAVDLRFDSVDDAIAIYDRAFGPFQMAREILDESAYAALLADIRALVEEADTGDGETVIPAQYLLTVAHRP